MDTEKDFSEHARRVIASSCLVATDVDRTLLAQGDAREEERFMTYMAPELARAANYGTRVALLTGNSMHELGSRFLRWIISYLCGICRPDLLSQFHLFCNGTGVYVRFPEEDDALKHLLARPSNPGMTSEQLFHAVTEATEEGKLAIRPRFVDPVYIQGSSICAGDLDRIAEILDRQARRYMVDLQANHETYASIYDLASISSDGHLALPNIDKRVVRYGPDGTKAATVQITLKPILSFRHASRPSELVGRDLRTTLSVKIQRELDLQGLGYCVARPGGQSSIDVSLEKVDKAYALESLIDRLNLQGNLRRGQKFGTNAIYLGDEVIVGGGNDYAVTRIPGLLVFAVNPDRDLIPYLSQVVIPSQTLDGPDATCEILRRVNDCTRSLLQQFDSGLRGGEQPTNRTALELFKEQLLAEQTHEQIANLMQRGHLSVDDWQVLHTLVDMLSRKDGKARQWLPLLMGELDASMSRFEIGLAPL